ncbi:hypothetical protein ABT352_14830 [Streptosporangium sp. NPDC000563]|uniref:hypothetical protein n=1 Tax=Streptosporangium sp. NPDC000563 TaxID=3154366 RepID=UPI0033296669
MTRGKVEFELCAEGGQDVIRRTDYTKKRVVVSEVGREMTRLATLDLWKLIVTDDAA